jgi:hypothetical protein
MLIRKFEELKEDIQKQLNEFQENLGKKLEKTQKQINAKRLQRNSRTKPWIIENRDN